MCKHIKERDFFLSFKTREQWFGSAEVACSNHGTTGVKIAGSPEGLPAIFMVAISQPQLNGYDQPQNKAKSDGGKAEFILDLQGFFILVSAETILAFPNTV